MAGQAVSAQSQTGRRADLARARFVWGPAEHSRKDARITFIRRPDQAPDVPQRGPKLYAAAGRLVQRSAVTDPEPRIDLVIFGEPR